MPASSEVLQDIQLPIRSLSLSVTSAEDHF